MDQYTETELTNKIHTFLGERFEKFPELRSNKFNPAHKARVKDYRESNIFTALENLNNLWARRVHS